MPRVAPLLLAGVASIFSQTNAPVGQPGYVSSVPPLATNYASGVIVSNGILVMSTNHNVPPTSILGTNIVVRNITLAEAVDMALKNNYDVQIVRYSPEIARFNLAGSYGVYEPAFGFNYTHFDNTDPGGFDPVTGAPIANTSEGDTFNANIGPSGYLPTGLRYQIGGGVTRSQFADLEERYRGNASINLTQPLLRDFWIDAERAEIMINKKDLKISEWQFREQLLITLSQVELTYYDLILRRENIKVQRLALEWANQLLRENKKRVEVGAMAPLDEKQAESEVARYLADLLQTEQAYAVQQNTLKNLITQDFASWTNIVVDPVETLVAVPITPELTESWRLGLTLRPELQQLKYQLESQNITLKFLRNQVWPALDLVGSYGHGSLNTSYGSTLSDLRRDDFPSYSYGVRLSIPVAGNIRARNSYKATQAQNKQLLLQYKQLEQTVMVEIDNAVKFLQSQFQQVEATRQARLFAQDALAAEQKKYENGKSTSFLVLQFQRDLTQRRFEELSALANYNKALASLAASQGTTFQRLKLDFNVE